MSPCCVAAATATAAATAFAVVGLTIFVLVTDAFGLVLVATTILAAILRASGRAVPPATLWYVLSVALAVRAGWLLATTRRPLAAAVWRFLVPRVAGVVRRAVSAVGRRERRPESILTSIHDGRFPPPRSAPGG